MDNLTPDQKEEIVKELKAYYDSCPPAAQAHMKANIEGFTAGWVCRAAYENNKKVQKDLDTW